jgi:SAM-dependent methyltransferase
VREIGDVLHAEYPSSMLRGMRSDTDAPDISSSTFYEELAQTRWGGSMSSAEEAAIRRAALSLRPSTALEIGCDGGRWSQLLTTLGWSITCVDVREEAIELCRERMPSARCLLVRPDDTSFPDADSSIGLLLVYEVPPVTNSPWFASEAARVVKPGGVLVCTVSNPKSVRGTVYRARMPVSPSRREKRVYAGPSFQDVRRRLGAHGFELVDEEGLGWAPFSRHSNSRLIPYFIWLERLAGLRRLVRLSPLVVVAARKTATGSLRGVPV